MLDQKLATLMQRILSKGDDRTVLTLGSQRLIDEFALGTRRGRTIYFNPRELNEMATLLASNGYALEPVDLTNLSRSERLAAGTPNEKAGGGSVKRGRISIKASAEGLPVLLSDQGIVLPPRCHLDAELMSMAVGTFHQSALVVENYEAFDRIHQVRLDLPDVFRNPLVIYRGDQSESRADVVDDFLTMTGLPVLAFVDIDPAGLLIASSFANLAGVIAPSAHVLAEQLASPATGRRDLFGQQYPGAANFLSSMPDSSPVAALWQLVLEHRAGVVQERWIGSEISCQPWVSPVAHEVAH